MFNNTHTKNTIKTKLWLAIWGRVQDLIKLNNPLKSVLRRGLLFRTTKCQGYHKRFYVNFSAVFNSVSSKFSLWPIIKYTDNPVNQSKLKVNKCSWQSAGKRVVLNHDWFCFYFWLDERVVQVLSQSCGIVRAKRVSFRRLRKLVYACKWYKSTRILIRYFSKMALHLNVFEFIFAVLSRLFCSLLAFVFYTCCILN